MRCPVRLTGMADPPPGCPHSVLPENESRLAPLPHARTTHDSGKLIRHDPTIQTNETESRAGNLGVRPPPAKSLERTRSMWSDTHPLDYELVAPVDAAREFSNALGEA
jgi:hypothetical protein